MMMRKIKENVSMALVVVTIATSALVMPVHAEANIDIDYSIAQRD